MCVTDEGVDRRSVGSRDGGETVSFSKMSKASHILPFAGDTDSAISPNGLSSQQSFATNI